MAKPRALRGWGKAIVRSMDERHENEQYLFDAPTLARLAGFLSGWERVCCLCAPLLGQHLARHGVAVTILDIDERFAGTPGFRRFDIYRPERLAARFSLIVCDPPFHKVSLSQLFAAVRVLSRYDLQQPLLISFLERRSAAMLGTFAPFGLRPTGYRPSHLTVQPGERTRVQFFSNLAEERLLPLTSPGL
jgi:hypothetical protein